MAWPASSWWGRWGSGLHLGQWVPCHLHSLGQRPARLDYCDYFTEWTGKPGHVRNSSLLSPDNGEGTCVAMTTGQPGGFWDDKPCSEKYAFICEKPRPDISPPTRPPTPPPSQGCSEGWTALPHFRNCYKVRQKVIHQKLMRSPFTNVLFCYIQLFHNVDWSSKKSWGAAREDCVARGGDLVSIHNQEEEDFLSLYSKASSKWIGLKRNSVEGGMFKDVCSISA